MQDLKDEVEELSAIDVAFKSELLVVLSHSSVVFVGKLSISRVTVGYHLEVFLLIFIILDIYTLGLAFFNAAVLFIFGN